MINKSFLLAAVVMGIYFLISAINFRFGLPTTLVQVVTVICFLLFIVIIVVSLSSKNKKL